MIRPPVTPTIVLALTRATLAPPAGAQTPYGEPNHEFYRLDTALFVPRENVATWKLRVHGMVGSRITSVGLAAVSERTVEAA